MAPMTNKIKSRETNTKTGETIDLFHKYVIPNYNRYAVSLVRGEGALIWDAEGRRYLDFFPGWGCNLLGHCPPEVVVVGVPWRRTAGGTSQRSGL